MSSHFAIIDGVPDHLLIQIFREVFFADLKSCALCCRHWKELIYCNITYLKAERIEIEKDSKPPDSGENLLGRCELEIFDAKVSIKTIHEVLEHDKFSWLISLSLPTANTMHLGAILGCLPSLKEISIFRVDKVDQQMLQCLIDYTEINPKLQRLFFLQKSDQSNQYDLSDYEHSKFLNIFLNRPQFQQLAMRYQPIINIETLPKLIQDLTTWPRMCYLISKNSDISVDHIRTSYPSYSTLNVRRCDSFIASLIEEQNFMNFFWNSGKLWLLVIRYFENHLEVECSKAEDTQFLTEFLRLMAIPNEATVYRSDAPDEFKTFPPDPDCRYSFGYRYVDGILNFVAHVYSDRPEIHDGQTWQFNDHPISVTLTTTLEELDGVCYFRPLLNSELVGITHRTFKNVPKNTRPLTITSLKTWRQFGMF